MSPERDRAWNTSAAVAQGAQVSTEYGRAADTSDRRDPGGDDWGPSVERKGRRRRGLRLLRTVLLLILLLALVVPFLISRQIPRVPVDGLAGSSRPMHVLVAGSDSRDGLTPEEQRQLSTGSSTVFDGERTDTVFLMTIQGGEVALLSFPRDLWVQRCDGTSGRINVAQSIDGPGCLVRTVRELSGIPVSHYLGISFGGFVEMVDAVDGVELCLEEAISDRDAGIDLPAGCQVLEGPDALGYVRVRKIDNDLQRIQRQQRFVQALAGELTDPATLFNPVRLWSVGGSVGGAVSADDGLGPIDMARLARGVRGLSAGSAPTYTVPADPGRTSGGADVLFVRETEAETLFSRFRDGSILDESAEALPPADIRVSVTNGAGVSGLATRVADLLEGRGYDIAEVGNADARDTTVVRHPPGSAAQARRLLEDLPSGAALEESRDVTTVTVVLGRDAAGLA
jgi:LCP family protein required for cell wall assembly